MHTTIISDVTIKPIRVKSEAKLSSSSRASRRLSRQASISNSSNEVFYGDSSVVAAVPFRWESQPGTPKVKLSERRHLPPLTPPPSYLCSPARNSVKKHPTEAATNSSILHTVLPKLNPIKKSNVHSSSPSLSSASISSSSSSSSSSPWSSSRSVRSSPFTPKSAGGQQRRRLSFYSRRKDHENDDEDEEYEFHVSSLCFGGAGRSSSNNIRPRASLIKLLLRG